MIGSYQMKSSKIMSSSTTRTLLELKPWRRSLWTWISRSAQRQSFLSLSTLLSYTIWRQLSCSSTLRSMKRETTLHASWFSALFLTCTRRRTRRICLHSLKNLSGRNRRHRAKVLKPHSWLRHIITWWISLHLRMLLMTASISCRLRAVRLILATRSCGPWTYLSMARSSQLAPSERRCGTLTFMTSLNS